MGDALVSLDDPAALDASIVGVKAARLAAARLGGYPVLPGFVVPRRHAEPALEAGRNAVDAGRPATARAAARSAAVPADLMEALPAVARLGSRLVVRSSTRVDDDPRWAGAFASYGDVAPGETLTAIRGCWASIFAPDVIARGSRMGTSATQIGLAALIQPQVEPALSGSAEATDAGVEIAAVAGPPGPLLSGWKAGTRLTVGRRGDIGGDGLRPQDAATVRRVAELARGARSEFGTGRVEWAATEGRVVIFQLSAGEVPASAPPTPVPDVGGLVAYRRLASMMLRRRGPLAEQLIAPWAGAVHRQVPSIPAAGSTAELFRLASRLADDLHDVVATGTDAGWAGLLDRLARGDRALGARLAEVSLDPITCGRLLGACDSIARAFVHEGLLRAPEEFWWQTPEWAAEAIAGRPVPASHRPSFDRFTGVLVGAIRTAGMRLRGVPASPGLAVGRAVRVRGPEDAARLRPGDVLVSEAALPAFAPLLWNASALATRQGSPGAHLFEVSRALRRPAVASIDGAWPPGEQSWAIGIDGTSGEVWLSEIDRDLQPR